MTMRIILLLLTLCCVQVSAQDHKRAHTRETTVTHSGIFSETVSPAKAKAIVLEEAKLEGVAKEFGTSVHSHAVNIDQSVDGKLTNTFYTKSESDVCGEWLETTREEWQTNVQGRSVEYTVTLRGRVRQWATDAVDLDIHLLRGGVDTLANKVHEGIFYNGDRINLYFRSPLSGYVAVYMTEELGEHQLAQRMLPYMRQDGEAYPVTADEEYWFFAPQMAKPFEQRKVVPLRVGCRDAVDINKLYVIFSPDPFVKAADAKVSDAMPPQLPLAQFQRWLSNCRRHNDRMQVQSYVVEIRRE